MDASWLFWIIGALVLIVAGFAMSYVARRRARALHTRSAWAAADAALASARISRDASAVDVESADDLLGRAELIAADRGGPSAAREAELLAARADRWWRGESDAG